MKNIVPTSILWGNSFHASVSVETVRHFFSLIFFGPIFNILWQVYPSWLHKKIKMKMVRILKVCRDSGWALLVLPWECEFLVLNNKHKCSVNTNSPAASPRLLRQPPSLCSCPGGPLVGSLTVAEGRCQPAGWKRKSDVPLPSWGTRWHTLF